MSISATALRAKQAASATYHLRRWGVRLRRDRARPLCLVYGNCQAEPIRALLAGSPEFADSYAAVRLPAVHELGPSHMARLQQVVRKASVLVVQQIKDGYRGLPLGTREIAALAPRNCTVIRFQALHYDALYPFQFNLRDENLRDVPAPLTAYHDLRALCAAAKGMNDDDAVRWFSDYRPPEAALRDAAEQAAALIRARERSTDIGIAESVIASPLAGSPSFLTVNHPARFVLQRTAQAIEQILGLDAVGDAGDAQGAREPLGRYRAPVEQPVVDALGLAWRPTVDWIVNCKRVPTGDVLRRHLSWYRRYPGLVRSALDTHSERIAAFHLL